MKQFVSAIVLLALVAGCASKPVRFATFNASLNRDHAGKLVEDLSTPDDPQAKKVAEIIQRVRPDVLLINEFDYAPGERAATLFSQNYLGIAQNGAEPIHFQYVYVVKSNTGVASSLDLDNDGKTVVEPGTRSYGNDALGYGLFEGQYAFVIYSRFPIQYDQIKTYGDVLWSHLPDSKMPTMFYSARALEVLPVSSKNHVDVPIEIDGKIIHVLAAHPTPPAFDGPEDRNGLRNYDEIRLLSFLVDRLANIVRSKPDEGNFCTTLDRNTPRAGAERFVVMGDMNADPNDGDSYNHAIHQLLDDSALDASFVPTSRGAAEAAKQQGGPNATHATDTASDTADFSESRGGNLRVDYILPYRGAEIIAGGAYWPPSDEPHHDLVDCSDHRLVWLDLRVQ